MNQLLKRSISILLLFAMLLTMVPCTLAHEDSESAVPIEVELSEEKPDEKAAIIAGDPAPYLTRINAMKIPAMEQVKPQSGTRILAEDGTYFLVGRSKRNSTYYTSIPKVRDTIYVTGDGTANYYIYDKTDVTVSNGSFPVSNLSQALYIHYMADNKYSIRLADGRFFTMNTSNKYNDTRNFQAGACKEMDIEEFDANTFRIGLSDSGIYINYNTYSFRAVVAQDLTHENYSMYLYRVSPLTLELYYAIEHMADYCKAGEQNKYDPTVYNEFLSALGDALTKYETYYTVKPSAVGSAAVTQAELDQTAEELRSYATKLTLAKENASFIDIPMEVLDFRSDRLLMEFYNLDYAGELYGFVNSLSTKTFHTNGDSSRLDSLLKPFVDTFDNTQYTRKVASTLPGTEGASARLGLTLDTLVNGQLLYAEHTVGYVAAAMLWDPVPNVKTFVNGSGVTRDMEAQNKEYAAQFDAADWNQTFWNKVTELSNYYHKNGLTLGDRIDVLGSWEKTLKKTEKNGGPLAGQNGGILLWSDVETAFDLSYYILNNLWRSVEEGDVLDDKKPYNLYLPERDTIRLYYDESTGMYSFRSDDHLFFDGHIMGTQQPFRENNQSYYPKVTPADGLGFEAGGTETDTGTHWATKGGRNTDLKDTNFNFTLHAYGSFIYYEDQDLQLTFLGDDDAYFFINDKLVIDVGGSHNPVGFTVDLNQINREQELGLVDGEIYRFDMFYAERHSTGANMIFTTNMNIVDTDTMTYEGQYLEVSDGRDLTDPKTGLGVELQDNAMVNIGDTVTYSFDIQNQRELPVFDVSFRNEKLGASISKDSVTLCGSGNGVTTDIDDIFVYYFSEDAAPDLSDLRWMSYDQMLDLLEEPLTVPDMVEQTTYAHLPTGSYVVRMETVDQLKTLLEMGIPRNSRMSVYGFKRVTTDSNEERPYSNTVSSSCSYTRVKAMGDGSYGTELFSINGSATRMLQVPDPTNFTLPTADKEQIVIDYGKRVEIPLDQLRNHIYLNHGTTEEESTSIGTMVGVTAEGYSGALLKYLPSDIGCTSEKSIFHTGNGAFSVADGALSYKPEQFLSETERAFAVYELKGCYGVTSTGTTTYRYILVEIEIIPANIMYYEAEDFADGDGSPIDSVITADSGSTKDDWQTVNEGMELLNIDPENLPEGSFYADFDGTGFTERYLTQPQYNSYDYDTISNWSTWDNPDSHMNSVSISNTAGTASTSIKLTADGTLPDKSTIYMQTSREFDEYFYLRFKPAEETFVQIRFKLENFVPKEDPDPRFVLSYYTTDSKKSVDEFGNEISDSLKNWGKFSLPQGTSDGEYHTVCYRLPTLEAVDCITTFRFSFDNVVSVDASRLGKMTLDYVYVGSNPDDKQDFDRASDIVYDPVIDRETIPSNAFFVDFDNDGFFSRYQNLTQYNRYDFDSTKHWATKENGGTQAFTINHAESVMYLDVHGSHDGTSAQNYGPYLGTAVTAGTFPTKSTEATLPLTYIPTGDDYVQIRFKFEDCTLVEGQVPWINVLYNYKDRTGTLKYAEDFGADFASRTAGDYQTVTFPVPSNTNFAKNAVEIRSFMLRFRNIKSLSSTAKGKIVIDYIYLGPESGLPEDLMQDPRMDERETYLFFDFTNTATDKERYKGKQYNGVNYDLANSWVGRTTGWNDGTDSVANGAITVKASKTKYTSIYIDSAVANGDNTRLLDYDPSYAEVFQFRFKASNLKGSSGFSAQVQFYADSSQTYKSSYGAAFDVKYLTNGEYVTVTGKIKPEMQQMERLRRLIVWVGGLDKTDTRYNDTTGTITFDYVFVGPQEQLDRIMKERSQLYFTFDNTAEDQYRYDGNVYNGYNFDLADNWEGRTTGWKDGTETLSNGAITVKAGTGVTGYGSIYIDSGAEKSKAGRPINYDPTNAEVFQIRFKASNLVGTTGTCGAEIQFYYKTDTTDYLRSNRAYFDATYLTSGQYITVTGTITDAMRKLEHVRRIVVWIGGLNDGSTTDKGTVTYDHVFIGPKSTLDEINAQLAGQESQKTQDYLYFSFDNGYADKYRYSNPVYGDKLNYDTIAQWNDGTNSKAVSISNGSLVFKDNEPTPVTDGGSGDNVWVSTKGNLNLTPHKNDYCEVRLKIDGATAKYDNGRVSFRIDFKDDKGDLYSSYSQYFTLSDYVDKGFFVLRFPMEDGISHDYINSDKIVQIRPVLTRTHNATVTISYLYIGPLTQSNPAQKSLFFGFDGSEEDLHRYNTDVTGYINYDSTGADLTKDQWLSYSAKVESLTVDSEEGVMKIVAKEKVPTLQDTGDYHESFPADNDVYPDVYFDTVINGDKSFPLDYKPDEAMICQIRVKMKNFALIPFTKSDGVEKIAGSPYFHLQYRKNGVTTNLTTSASLNFDVKYLTNNEYIVLRLPLDTAACEDMRNASNINRLRFYFGGIGSISPDRKGEMVIDYIYLGPEETAPTVYGYDSSYTDDAYLSHRNSLFVEGQGIKLTGKETAYTESYFSFTGTGFDLISRTGKEQATIRVSVYSDPERLNVVKSLTVNNKGELELYQIPVASIQGLVHGTYYVTVGVNKALTYGMVGDMDMSFMNRGGEFYHDGIRIYDPVNVEVTDTHSQLTAMEQTVLNAYIFHKEAYNYIKEVRNILLDAETFKALNGTVEGAVFLDVNSAIVNPDDKDEDGFVDGSTPGGNYTSTSVQTYNKIGPKNEVYLSPKQAVAFKLQIDSTQIPKSLDVGVKVIDGSSANLVAGIVGSSGTMESVLTATKRTDIIVNSATAQYYELALSSSQIIKDSVNNDKYVYVVIYNNSAVSSGAVTDAVLSVTDIKVAYNTTPNSAVLPEDNISDPEIKRSTRGTNAEDAPVRFLVDKETQQVVEVFLKASAQTPVDDTPTTVDGIRIYHSLDLASDISINYVVPKTDLEGYEAIRLVCVLPVFEGNVQTRTEQVVVEAVERGSYYYFVLPGLTAVQMNDCIEAALELTKDGRTYVTPTDTYSIAQYARAQMEKETTNQSLKTLCADLLRYGGRAQLYKAYRVDSLADSTMTAEQKAFQSNIDAVNFGNNNSVAEDLKDAPVVWAGKALDLGSKVTLKFVFDPANFAGDIHELSLRLSYEGLGGELQQIVLEEATLYSAGWGLYAFTFDSLLAAELRSVVSAQIYCGEVPVSCTLHYSADSYGNNKTGSLLELCKALFAYADSAKAYFGD